MSLYMQKGTPSDGPDEVMHCSFFAFDLGICTADADGRADQPCYYCVRQHPHILKENIKRRRDQSHCLHDRVHDSNIDVSSTSSRKMRPDLLLGGPYVISVTSSKVTTTSITHGLRNYSKQETAQLGEEKEPPALFPHHRLRISANPFGALPRMC